VAGFSGHFAPLHYGQIASAAAFQNFHTDFCKMWKSKGLHETGVAMMDDYA
jgi:hypothetical protein